MLALSCDNPLGDLTTISDDFNPEEEIAGSVPNLIGLSDITEYTSTTSWTWSCDQSCSVRFLVDQNESSQPSGTYSETYSTGPEGAVEGTYYLHIQVKNSSGNESEVFHYRALFDNTPPTLTGSITTSNPETHATKSANHTWTAPSDNGSGLSHQDLTIVLENGDGSCNSDDLSGTSAVSWSKVPASIESTSGWQINHGDQDGDSNALSLNLSFSDYCTAIRAVDNAGNTSDPIYSSGWHIFQPSDISSIELWYDASDATTMYTDTNCTTNVSSSSDLVRCWKDKSDLVNGDHATESTNPPSYITSVQNSLSATRWSSKQLIIAAAGTGPINDIGTGPFTVVALFTNSTPGSNGLYPIIVSRPQFTFGATYGAPNFVYTAVANNSFYNSGVSASTTTPNTFLWSRDSTGSSSFQYNFSTTNTSAALSGTIANGSAAYTLGGDVATDKFEGDMFEVIMFTTAISTSDINSIKTYLSKKWNIEY